MTGKPVHTTEGDTNDWDNARTAYDRVQGATYYNLPEDAKRATDALGNLLAVHDGYGEE